MLIDSHTHIDIISGDAAQQDAIIRRATDAGIGLIINAGTEAGSLGPAQAMAVWNPAVRYAAGLHPEILNPENGRHDLEAELEAVTGALTNRNCVAIGEIGLDYYHNKGNKAGQIALFERQCGLAAERGMPVIIHSREAWDDTFAVVEKFRGRLTGIFHCFSGGAGEARRCLDLGFFISFAGNLTYPTAGLLREAALFAPVDRVFLETDAPYLAPVPMRGKRNEPAFVAHTYAFYAELKKAAVDDIAHTHEAGMKALIGLSRDARN